MIWITWENTLTPSALRNALATAPPATRAAVSRALARSRMSRTSVSPYFWVPTRSAWPGRGRCTSAVCASTGHGFIRSSQLAKSRLVDRERDRAAQGAAVADAAGDLDPVALDLHPPAAAVAELAASQVAVQRVALQRQPGGHALARCR